MANETNGRCGTKYISMSKDHWNQIFGKKENRELNNLDELIDENITDDTTHDPR